MAIRREGTSDNVAAAAWVTNAVTGMMRLFTHLNSKVGEEEGLIKMILLLRLHPSPLSSSTPV